ncbi:MAG: tetratricopeptide repeat protein [Deltaproteobacteria bacterium]|nr:tetratricopeptide repeat protein [Deltaproteobacteria bacterium]
MTRRLAGLLFVLALVAAPSAAIATSLASLFDEGNNAFWNGDYEKAVKAYDRLEALGVRSAGLSYNLGTAKARLGRLGEAVRHYERALLLDPGHEDARYNLGLVREFLARRASEAGRDADLAPAAGPWRAVLDRFSPFAAALAFLVFHLALFGVLVARRFVAAELPRMTLGVTAGVLAALTAATLAVTVGKWHQLEHEREAVVTARGQTDAVEGPGSAVRRFGLEEGSRVRVLERREGWTRVRDDRGRDGWARSETVGDI